MKKFMLIAVAFIGMTVMSCSNKTTGCDVENDTVTVDTVVVDSVA